LDAELPETAVHRQSVEFSSFYIASRRLNGQNLTLNVGA
jgi:hypothetical protein